MSEYQYIAFRAIDGPVSDRNLKYMRRQSTRAEITPWSFENEYHFGDFHGNAIEMLRRGYDIHVHYANFGIRNLYVRLPDGYPGGKGAKPYVDSESIRLVKDRTGRGATLIVQPFFEPGDLEELWDLEETLDRLIPLRTELLSGDLRPLYLAHLAISRDNEHDPEETLEAPVPAGLQKPTNAQLALAELYEISEAVIAAAARHSAPLPPKNRKQPWPTEPATRTIAELEAAADEIQAASDKKQAAKAARERAKKLANMAADPKPYLRKTERLVAKRSTDAYREISELLAELREALADSDESGLAEKQAQKLKEKNPTRRHLTAALRREGFVPK